MKKQILLTSALFSMAFMGTQTPAAQAFGLDYNILSGAYLHVQNNSFISVATKADHQGAQAMIDRMGQRAVKFLSDSSLSKTQKEKEFRKLLNDTFDMQTIGRFALGKNWKSASSAQQREYQRLFNDLVVKVYSSRFDDYKGQNFEVASARDTGKRDITVSSYIIPSTGSKINLDWRVRKSGGQYKIIDVIIEGVSMTLTQRSDFSSVIQRGGGDIEVLLNHLRK